MRRNIKRMFAILFVSALALTLVACGGGSAKENHTVRVGIHSNEGGATLFAVAQDQGYFEEQGLTIELTVVESGPAEMAAMRADNRSLDVGYIGAGVSWNAIDDFGNRLRFIYLDCLSNSEMFIANPAKKPGINKDSTWNELYEALKGSTVAIPTDTTPGSWFKMFLEKVNNLAGPGETPVVDADKLWIHSETDAYLEGYVAPNNNEANKITVVTESNEYLPQAYKEYDFVAGFAPATTSVLASGGVEVATTSSHLPENSFPSTWVASEKWMLENPAVVQKFINALAKATEWRSKNLEKSLRLAETLLQVNQNTFTADSLIAPSAKELYNWFATYDGLGYIYFNGMYKDKVNNVPAGNRAKTLPEALEVSYMLKGLSEVIK